MSKFCFQEYEDNEEDFDDDDDREKVCFVERIFGCNNFPNEV